MNTQKSPENALSIKRPIIKAGEKLYGIAKRNRYARIIVHSDQPVKDGKLDGKTILGHIEIITLGSAIKSYPKLERYVTTRETVSVEACDEMILSQEGYVKKGSKLHHLFRYNGWTTEEHLKPDEKLSAKENEKNDEKTSALRKKKAEENYASGEVASNDSDTPPLDKVLGEDPLDIYESEEGRKILVTHYKRERDPRLVREAKEWYLSQEGNEEAPCEACSEEQLAVYGVNILEAHHKDPIGDAEGTTKNNIYDFNHLCPSCHRALHRMGKGATLEKFTAWLSGRGKKFWAGKQ